MALRFVTRSPDRLFFPTLHVHHGDVPAEAAFDHTLYLQAPAGVSAKQDWERATHRVSEVVNLGNILHSNPTRGLIQRKWPLFAPPDQRDAPQHGHLGGARLGSVDCGPIRD